MGNWFLDKLTKLAEGKISFKNNSLINLNINITKNSNNTPVILNENKNQLDLDISQLSEPQKKIFKEISDRYIEEGNYLLETSSFDLLEKLYKFNQDNYYIEHLSFYKGKISNDDYLALELSYFIRNLMINAPNQNISLYKSNISYRFGKRGGHIANLCTAGYFEELLIPIYQYSEKEFEYYYDIVVNEGALTLFIHKDMSSNEIIVTIEDKIKVLKSYGLPSLYIHSRGKRNINTIRRCLKDFSNKHFKLNIQEKSIPKYDILVSKISVFV